MTNTNTIKVGTFSLFKDYDAHQPVNRDATYEFIHTLVTGNKLLAKTDELRALTPDREAAAAAVDTAITNGVDEAKVNQLKTDAKLIETKQSDLKKALPFLTISARYDEAAKGKGKEQPFSHSGQLCFDFDHLSTVEMGRLTALFRSDDKTVLLFTSPRGEGLKRCVTVNGVTLDNHKAVYYALMLEHWYSFQAGADLSCVNVNRGTFLPHDANAYYNKAATQYEAAQLLAAYPNAELEMKTVGKQLKLGITPIFSRNNIGFSGTPVLGTTTLDGNNTTKVITKLFKAGSYTKEENFAALDHIVDECERLNINLSDSHTNNILIGWALHNIGADASYFHRITCINPDYNRLRMEERFNNLERLHDTERCGFGALVNLAKQAGITAQKPVKLSVSNNQKITQMDIRDAVKQLYDVYQDAGSGQHYYAPTGDLNPFNFTPFTERSTFLNEILGELEGMQLFISKGKLTETLFNKLTYKVIDYLTLQLDWLAADYDGKDHLTKLISSLTTEDNALFDTQFRKWIVNLVAQVYDSEPAGRNDAAFILVGAQGLGKTGFFEMLLWSPKWFVSKPDFNFNNKEHQLLMNSKVLILLDEMSSYNKADIKDLKGVFSKTVINVDKKYQEAADYKRNASFAGCSNNSDFLRDDTGDRRFLVFQMLGYDRAIYNAVDKSQLWGQLVTMYKNGFDYKFTLNEIDATITRNLEQYTQHKPEDTFINERLEITGNPADFLSNDRIRTLLNEYAYANHEKFMSISTVRAKLSMAGVTVNHAKKMKTGLGVWKTVKGYAGVREPGGYDEPAAVPENKVTNPNSDELAALMAVVAKLTI